MSASWYIPQFAQNRLEQPRRVAPADLRIMRRGGRHDPKELTVSFRFEGNFAAAFREGRADGLVPGEALKNVVHRTARPRRRPPFTSHGRQVAVVPGVDGLSLMRTAGFAPPTPVDTAVRGAPGLFSAGLENPDDLFGALEEPLGMVEVTVERDA